MHDDVLTVKSAFKVDFRSTYITISEFTQGKGAFYSGTLKKGKGN